MSRRSGGGLSGNACMIASDLRLAPQQMRAFIISQAEQRLFGQMQFATAADQRSATVSGAATALATLSFGISAQAIASGKASAFGVAAAIVGLGFAVAAWFALKSARCQDFHPAGFYPENFRRDVQSRKPMAKVQLEIAEDLNERLIFNSNILTWRGRQIDVATNIMFLSPFFGVLFVVLVRLSEFYQIDEWIRSFCCVVK